MESTTPEDQALQQQFKRYRDSTRFLKGQKDHTCPFCEQSFTSSSLGRHLDQFIRPSNPKPPDGQHNVEQIRAMRSKITRRQPRTSRSSIEKDDTSEQDTNGGADSPIVPLRETPSSFVRAPDQREDGMVRPVNIRANEAVKGLFNSAGWQATGVINNIPPSSMAPIAPIRSSHYPHPVASPLRPTASHPNGIRQNADAFEVSDEPDIGRAAQLALNEVLECLNTARSQLNTAHLFDFDFFGMTFPALCLHVVPGTTIMHSTGSFVPQDHWSVHPPGQTQLEDVRRQIGIRVDQFRPSLSPTESQRYLDHLTDAWDHWQSTDEEAKQQLWSREGLRAFALSHEREKNAQADLFQVRQELALLRRQVDRSKKQQLAPEESAIDVPGIALSADLSRAVHTQLYEDNELSLDTILQKWHDRVRASRYRNYGASIDASEVAARNLVDPVIMHDSGRSVGARQDLDLDNGAKPAKRKHASVDGEGVDVGESEGQSGASHRSSRTRA